MVIVQIGKLARGKQDDKVGSQVELIVQSLLADRMRMVECRIPDSEGSKTTRVSKGGGGQKKRRGGERGEGKMLLLTEAVENVILPKMRVVVNKEAGEHGQSSPSVRAKRATYLLCIIASTLVEAGTDRKRAPGSLRHLSSAAKQASVGEFQGYIQIRQGVK